MPDQGIHTVTIPEAVRRLSGSCQELPGAAGNLRAPPPETPVPPARLPVRRGCSNGSWQ